MIARFIIALVGWWLAAAAFLPPNAGILLVAGHPRLPSSKSRVSLPPPSLGAWLAPSLPRLKELLNYAGIMNKSESFRLCTWCGSDKTFRLCTWRQKDEWNCVNESVLNRSEINNYFLAIKIYFLKNINGIRPPIIDFIFFPVAS